jgi:PBSX family phage terminase large subunit
MQDPFSKKQLEYIQNSNKLWNLADGAVSTGKTVCTTFRFLEAVNKCPDSEIAIIGKTSTTLYNNVIKLILESPELSMFRPFCSWSSSKHELHFKDKIISTYGAKDESSYQLIQGRTLSLALCDEMTLYPNSFIEMLETRLRKPHSMAFAAMNPSYPTHRIKTWIDKAEKGDPEYYALHFVLDDNPYLTDAYKKRTKENNSGLFYKRNVLGLWVLAEGGIFDFFDKNIHVVEKPPRGAEYFIAAIDYGLNNPYACVLIGVSTGRHIQEGKKLWVQEEYYYDHKKNNKQKTVSELARETANFLEPYNVKQLYIDPSALPIKLDLQRLGIHTVDANNEVLDGIGIMCSEMSKGNLVVMNTCKNLIREIESYVWDNKAAEKGYDEPLKKDDHAVDALRYAIASHKVPTYQPYKDGHNPDQYKGGRFDPPRRSIF